MNKIYLLFFTAVLLGVSVLTSGCGRKPADAPPPPDLRVHVRDAQGLGAGAAVQWRGVEVGRVRSVTMDKGMVSVDVMLHEAHRGQLRDGLRARPSRGFLGRGAATLELYGGDDSGQSALKRGAVIAEATVVDRITPGQVKAIGLLIAAVVIFLVVLSIVRKLAVFALALALLVFAGWFLYRQWQTHGDEFEAARMEMKWSDMARTMLTEQAAQDAWIAVQTDLAKAIRDAGGIGRDKLAEATLGLRASLEKKAAELAEQGKAQAAEEVRKLIKDMVDDKEENP